MTRTNVIGQFILSVASAITMFADPPQSRSTFPPADRTSIFEMFLFGFVSFFPLANLNVFLEWYASVCVCVCSVESGGVDNYIGRRGDNSIWHQLQVPSCWLFFWHYRHSQCVIDDLIFCADSIHLDGQAGDLCVHTECEISRLLDFISTLQAKTGACAWTRVSRDLLLLLLRVSAHQVTLQKHAKYPPTLNSFLRF